MKINWNTISDLEKFVKVVLAKETDDIPMDKIDQGKWVLEEIDLSRLSVDEELISDHDKDPLHIKRRDDFVDLINTGTPIKPLIALDKKMFLVDGYARYRALKKLGFKKAMVLRQEW